jgi:DUF4097 and DUF4098 domain-containing protein YvlB
MSAVLASILLATLAAFPLGGSVHRAFQLTGPISVDASTFSGSIAVRGGDPGTADVTAIQRARSQADLPLLEPSIALSGTILTLRALDSDACASRCGSVDFTIVVPRGSRLTLRTSNGAIAVTGAKAPVVLSAANGAVTDDAVIGNSTIGTSNGDVAVTVTDRNLEYLRATTSNGNVSVHLPANVSVAANLSAVSGRIDTGGLAFQNVSNERGAFNGSLGSGRGSLVLATSNGNITLASP